jgi:hypothetical protein
LKEFFIVPVFIVSMFILGSVNNSYSQPKESKQTSTITGEVIDVNCYLSDGEEGRGPNHKECAEMCAKAGVPLAILTQDGDIYYPISPMGKNPNTILMDYIAKQVDVSGQVFKRGNNYGIKISTIGESAK